MEEHGKMADAAYRVEAFNTAKQSENRIHDDSVARRFGFTGGLVPGVDVYAYMTHLPVARWGRAWLEHGTADCRFGKPVYDGETALVSAAPDGDGMSLLVESQGNVCATGAAALPTAEAAPKLADWPEPKAPPAAEDRPPASPASLAAGLWLGVRPLPVTPEFGAQYYADVRETDPLYADAGLVHPGLILRLCNWALGQNVVLGPWIHVGSQVRNFAAGRIGETLTVRARVARNYEHKGHLFVELDALALGDGRPLARIAHTAIYRPRQVAEA
jgi:hypothetical protein